MTPVYADSITYQYYLKGDWEKLISTGKEAIHEHVDFKYLRQRIGYAYFVKGDYYASEEQYEKALSFDKKDSITRIYLYYCGLYTNNESLIRYRVSKLPVNEKKSLLVKPLRVLDAIDVEYNYRINRDQTRSNPNYYRIGVNSQLGYRLNLYQSFSTYGQRIDSTGISQNEYFALLSWTLTSHITLSTGYHYLSSNLVDTITYRIDRRMKRTIIDSTFYPGHLFYVGASYRLKRFDLGINGSILSYASQLTKQGEISAGYLFPGKLNLYVKSSLDGMIDPNSQRLIFTQSVGSLLSPFLWMEGKITLGNLKNYSEFNGLYIYNSDDATDFRAGLSLYWYVSKKITFLANYSYNRKEYENTNNATVYYNQHSITSGIIWKI